MSEMFFGIKSTVIIVLEFLERLVHLTTVSVYEHLRIFEKYY